MAKPFSGYRDYLTPDVAQPMAVGEQLSERGKAERTKITQALADAKKRLMMLRGR